MNVREDFEIELQNWQHPYKDLATEHLKQEMFRQFKMLNPVPKYSIYLHTHKAELDEIAKTEMHDSSETSVRTTDFDRNVYRYREEFEKKVADGEGHNYEGRYLKTTEIAQSLAKLTNIIHRFEIYHSTGKDKNKTVKSLADNFSQTLNRLGNARFSRDVLQRVSDDEGNIRLLVDHMMGMLNEPEYNKRHESYLIMKSTFNHFLRKFVVVDKSERKYILPTDVIIQLKNNFSGDLWEKGIDLAQFLEYWLEGGKEHNLPICKNKINNVVYLLVLLKGRTGYKESEIAQALGIKGFKEKKSKILTKADRPDLVSIKDRLKDMGLYNRSSY